VGEKRIPEIAPFGVNKEAGNQQKRRPRADGGLRENPATRQRWERTLRKKNDRLVEIKKKKKQNLDKRAR